MADHKFLYIPDASVVLKWATFDEEDHEQALQFERDLRSEMVQASIPPHFFPEICNMLGRKNPKAAVSFFTYLSELSFHEYPLTTRLASLGFLLMEKFSGITFYDASYHALAIIENGTFLTADEKYYRTAYREGHIMLLKDYGRKR